MNNSFEKINEERRAKEIIKENIIKQRAVNNLDEVFYVGSLDLVDDYCGKSIYVMSKQQKEELEAREISEHSAEDDYEINEADLEAANEIYQRLMNEAAADERARQEEIEAIKRQAEKTSDISVYTSGSPSANYGSTPMSESDSAAFESIMNNNQAYTKSIENLIAENQ